MEGPIYPDIRKGPKRFIWTKKTSKVDVGDTVMSFEDSPEYYDHFILARNYNENSQHLYGKRATYTTAVNDNFRPPLQDLEDISPISRLRAPHVFGRINPSGGYLKQNTSLNNIDGFLLDEDRIREGAIRPILQTSVSFFGAPERELALDRNLPEYSVSAGERYSRVDDIESQNPHYDLQETLPKTSVTAGFKEPFSLVSLPEDPHLQLETNLPIISVDAGQRFGARYEPEEIKMMDGTVRKVRDREAQEGHYHAGYRTDVSNFEPIELTPEQIKESKKRSGTSHAGFYHPRIQGPTDLIDESRITLGDNLPRHSVEAMGGPTLPGEVVTLSRGYDGREVQRVTGRSAGKMVINHKSLNNQTPETFNLQDPSKIPAEVLGRKKVLLTRRQTRSDVRWDPSLGSEVSGARGEGSDRKVRLGTSDRLGRRIASTVPKKALNLPKGVTVTNVPLNYIPPTRRG